MITTHGGLFEGIGGFSLGAKRCGLTTKWICELDKYRRNILRKNISDAHQFKNIRTTKSPPPVDLITGGFPCQNISTAGGRSGIIGTESQLWFEYLRIIYEVQPRYVIIENSTQLRNAGIEFILYDLSKIGYDAEWECLQASQFGYRHKRERCFIVAYPSEIRRNQIGNVQIFKEINEILGDTYRPVDLSMPIKRFNRATNSNDVRNNYGFSKGLDRNRIAAIGDAVSPDIAEYIIKCIKLFDSITKK
ncbi:MAG: DNA (cytosine-5-)-methyltransferase [Sediminibacterium sp.]|nr:DNA (cytosine-5-)-methyltransferase [Sediminibacterium sp.]